MKKLTALLLALVIAVTACSRSIPSSYSLNDIGKTFGQIRAEHPELIFEDAGWVVNFCCLKAPDRDFYYYFYSYQVDNAASLEDLGALYGDELKAVGVIATVGDVFPDKPDNLPIEIFFKAIGVSEYDYDAFGHYFFEYGNAYCEIEAPEDAEFMERGFHILYGIDEIARSNHEVIKDYFEE